jgi:hypothetical protein
MKIKERELRNCSERWREAGRASKGRRKLVIPSASNIRALLLEEVKE